MKLNKELIQQLKEGKIQIHNNKGESDSEELSEVINEAIGTGYELLGNHNYYYINSKFSCGYNCLNDYSPSKGPPVRLDNFFIEESDTEFFNSFLEGETQLDMNKEKYPFIEEEGETVKDSRFPFRLNSSNAKRIIDSACEKWTDKLASKWGKDLLLYTYIAVEEDFYLQMRKACTPTQHKLFNDIFGKDKEYLYITDDGVKIYEGEHIWFVGKTEISKIDAIKQAIIGGRYFSTEEKAKEYMIERDWVSNSWYAVKDDANMYNWLIRYSATKLGEFYYHQKKTGNTVQYSRYIKIEDLELPE